MENFGKVGVLYGGSSAEREVSLTSGVGVHRALRQQGVDVHLFDTGLRSLAELAAQGFDRVFIALHGRWGEDGTIQGALELLRIPYTGSGPAACALAMDKVMTKRIWLQHTLPTPRFAVLKPDSDFDRIVHDLGLPLIVKPSHEGSTLGLTRVEQAEQMADAYRVASRYDTEVLAEEFIQGRELTVAIMGQGDEAYALPIVEIIAPGGNYDYLHKYHSTQTQYICPAELPTPLAAYIQRISLRAYRAVGCSGWGRVDVMLSHDNRAFLLEVNTAPGMTGHSLVPMAAQAAGMSYPELCVEILRTARCHIAQPSVVTAVDPHSGT